MSATTEQSALLQGLALYDEMVAAVDERTLQILDRRRRTAVVRRRGWLVRRMLLGADVFGLVTAMLLAEWLINRRSNHGVMATPSEILAFVVALPLWIVIAKLYGLYERDEERTDHSTADDFSPVFHMVTVCTFVFWAFSYLTRLAHPYPSKLLIFWAVAIGLITTSRAMARAVARRNIAYLQNTVIVGAGDVGQLIAKKLLQHPEYGINLVGFVDDQPKDRRAELEHLTLLGGTGHLPAVIRLLDVERVIVAFSNASHSELIGLIRSLRGLDVQVDVVPRLFELVGSRVGVHTVEGLPLIGLPPPRLSSSSLLLKRMLDLAASVLLLVVLAPFLALVAVAIRLDSRGPVFFRQVRMGADERTFRIWKLRTMRVGADEEKHEVAHLNQHLAPGGDDRMFKIPDDPRLTRVGRWLRRYALDELPQLVNVLAGQMSLVGPRPLILEEDRHVDPWARARLNLKPGITGPWQVLGRNSIPFAEMVTLDYLYVTSWSPFGDLKLMARTLPVLLRGRGV